MPGIIQLTGNNGEKMLNLIRDISLWCHTDLHLILCFTQMVWLALVFKPSKRSLIFFFSLSRWSIVKLSRHEGFMSMSFFSFDVFLRNGNWGVLDSYMDKFFWVFRVGNFWGLAFPGAKQPAAVSMNWLGPVICPGLELCVLIYNRQELFPRIYVAYKKKATNFCLLCPVTTTSILLSLSPSTPTYAASVVSSIHTVETVETVCLVIEDYRLWTSRFILWAQQMEDWWV